MNRRSYAILLLATLAILAGSTRSPQAGLADTGCTAAPGRVTLTAGGLVRSGHVKVTCAGRWQLDEAVQYWGADDEKWIFGGRESVAGHGSTTVPSFLRPYHECGSWRLHAVLNGAVTNGPTTVFCS